MLSKKNQQILQEEIFSFQQKILHLSEFFPLFFVTKITAAAASKR